MGRSGPHRRAAVGGRQARYGPAPRIVECFLRIDIANSLLARHAHLCTCPHLFPPAKEHASSKPHHDKPHDDASPVALGDEEDEDGVRKSRRKRKNEDEEDDGDDPTVVADMEHDEHEGMDEASLKEHEEVTKVKVRYLFRCQLIL